MLYRVAGSGQEQCRPWEAGRLCASCPIRRPVLSPHAARCSQVVLLSDFDIRDVEMVKYVISRSNVVVNLIGQRMETMNFKFEDVHVKWPKTLAE